MRKFDTNLIFFSPCNAFKILFLKRLKNMMILALLKDGTPEFRDEIHSNY